MIRLHIKSKQEAVERLKVIREKESVLFDLYRLSDLYSTNGEQDTLHLRVVKDYLRRLRIYDTVEKFSSVSPNFDERERIVRYCIVSPFEDERENAEYGELQSLAEKILSCQCLEDMERFRISWYGFEELKEKLLDTRRGIKALMMLIEVWDRCEVTSDDDYTGTISKLYIRYQSINRVVEYLKKNEYLKQNGEKASRDRVRQNLDCGYANDAEIRRCVWAIQGAQGGWVGFTSRYEEDNSGKEYPMAGIETVWPLNEREMLMV